MRITDEAFEALKAKDARCKKLSVKLKEGVVDIVVRPPSWAEYSGWRQMIRSSDSAKQAAANKQLLLFCTLFPDPKAKDGEFEALVNRNPGLPDNLSTHIGELSGLTAEVEVGE